MQVLVHTGGLTQWAACSEAAVAEMDGVDDGGKGDMDGQGSGAPEEARAGRLGGPPAGSLLGQEPAPAEAREAESGSWNGARRAWQHTRPLRCSPPPAKGLLCQQSRQLYLAADPVCQGARPRLLHTAITQKGNVGCAGLPSALATLHVTYR